MDQPSIQLTAHRFLVRSMLLADAPTVAGYRSDSETARLLAPTDHRMQPDGAMIGNRRLHLVDHETAQAEAGITLDRAYWGRGFAIGALAATLTHLSDVLGNRCVYARVDPANDAAIALLQRPGMQFEGRLRETIWHHSARADDLLYAMTCQTCPNGQNPI